MRLAVVLLSALVLAAAASATVVKASLTGSTHRPVVGKPWTWTLVVADGSGKALPAKAKLQITVAGIVVGCWKAGKMQACRGATAGTSISFVGKKTGVIRWTAESKGVPLTFRALVAAGGTTTKLRYAVTVR
jgi:hypothetical protein